MTTLRQVVALLIVTGIGCFAYRPAGACSCFTQPCAWAGSADVIVAGEVLDISPVDSPDGQERVWRARVRVTETFKGAPGPLVDIFPPSANSSCNYGFTVNRAYLIYAYRNTAGRLVTGLCSGTSTLANASTEVSYLRTLAHTASDNGLIRGQVFRPTPDFDVTGLTVTAESPGGRVVTTTDREGRFSLATPRGRHVVTVTAPAGLWNETGTIDVTATVVCTDAMLRVRHEGRISGRVIDQRGLGVPGFVMGIYDAINARPGVSRQPSSDVVTDTDGRYAFTDLAPGIYAIGTAVPLGPSSPSPQMYLHGAGSLFDAAPFSLALGQRLTMSDFVLPDSLKLFRLEGVALDGDRPVAGVTVSVVRRTSGGLVRFGRATVTGADGRFVISVPEGTAYRLRGSTVSPTHARETESPPFDLTGDRTGVPLRFDAAADRGRK